MNSRKLFNSIGEIKDSFIDEASPKDKVQPIKRRFSVTRVTVAAAFILVMVVPLTIFAVETFRYNAAVTYFTSLGIKTEDLSDYSRREVIDAFKTYDAGESNSLIETLLQKNDKISVTDTMSQVTSEQVSNVEMIRDLSVNSERNYSVPDSDSNVLEVVLTADEVYQHDLKEIISVSDDVIRVTVQNVTFTSCEGVAWTKSDVLITDTFKGDLKIGDVISVFTLGGYIPLSDHIEVHDDAFRFKDLSAEEIETTFLKETIDGEKTIQKSEDLILCIVQTPKDSPLPNGAYERVSYSGQLYAEGNKEFIQMITDGPDITKKTYSYDDIKEMTE